MASASSVNASEPLALLLYERLRPVASRRPVGVERRRQPSGLSPTELPAGVEARTVTPADIRRCSVLHLQAGGACRLPQRRPLHTTPWRQQYTGMGKRGQPRTVLGRLLLGQQQQQQSSQQQQQQQQQQSGDAGSVQSMMNQITKDVSLDSHSQNVVLLRLFEAYRKGLQDGQSGGRQEQGARRLHEVAWQWAWGLLKVVLLGGSVYLLFTVLNARDSLSKVMMNDLMIRKETSSVTFSDVRGCDAAKKELQDIVSFLMRPESFQRLGARLPRGVLLVGPPGVGKTMLAKAVAGEANVPFFQCSGSQFDEVFVGTGAARVRRLFEEAKKSSPCVVFIDEFDSVGAKRVTTTHHPYANQTVNQLLAEMDGFATHDGVIVLAATNRPEILDSAVTRPGRFDVSVQVQLPDLAGRKSILELYLDKVSVAEDVDVERLAKMTMGCSGAELANIVNQAAVIGGLEHSASVTWSHLQTAYNKVTMGTVGNKPQMDTVNLMTAAHESGHTIVSLYTKGAAQVNHVTILPRGMSLGHTAPLPDESDQYGRKKSQLLASIDVYMGGLVAEELMFGADSVSTGCSSDLERATDTAKMMVYRLGMSERLGVMTVAPDTSSQATLALAEAEVKRILDESKERVRVLVRDRRAELERLTTALVEFESLDRDDIVRVVAGKRPTKATELSSRASAADKSGDASWLKSLLNSLNPDVGKAAAAPAPELKDKDSAPAPGV